MQRAGSQGAGDRHRHGPPRPPERAGEHAGQDAQDLFAEFDHTAPEAPAAGDVKYHQASRATSPRLAARCTLSLAFNPSHLEIVNPVVEGSVKARMDRRGDKTGAQVLPVLVHGDAAFAGQGVVMERWRWRRRAATSPAAPMHTGGEQPDRLHHQRSARQPLHAVLLRRRRR